MSNGSPAVRCTPKGGHSFSPGPERLVASENLSVRNGQSPTAPSADDTGDGTETPYHPFNEHFSHGNGGGTSTSQTEGEGADECYSPIYGENQISSWNLENPCASDGPP
jgi:hypothetical protein